MCTRTLFIALLASAALSAGTGAAPLPAPTEALKDYRALGVIQIDLPGGRPSAVTVAGGTQSEPGLNLYIPMYQAYVRPDRLLVQLNLFGSQQAILAMGNTERTFTPASGYIVERTYRNLDPAAESPMTAAQLSMTTYARVLRELDSGRLLPDEDLDKLAAAHDERMKQLAALRKELLDSKKPDDVLRAGDAAAEMARIRDDLTQIAFRREHPCHVVEFPNKDVLSHLLSRKLMGDSSTEILQKGKTTAWITKDTGLPIKLETTASDGRVVVYVCFTEIKVNTGLKSSEVVLGAPAGSMLVRATADLKDRDWEKKMEKQLNDQIGLIEAQRSRTKRPRPKS